ncbi:photosynthetic complex putative assembly protein PuhB [Sphingomonas sp. 35-24ZXX]|uniref:photosynthetic complex putative assembly protein PuhB n=1 Tax=Sphingomonas sp. 35-24ZXX TaxID=1545915 RepID=UPI0009DFE848|nr:photosynthetic complex putative assembly protein PuhB [Sphingomonas sp. 35-24ZXX]
MITEYDDEPVRGLPGELPEGEALLWQGSPDWRLLARSAFFTRIVGLYFAALVVLAIYNGSTSGVIATMIAGALGIGLLMLYAWAVARTTVYTLTNRRVVLRVGVALNMCINLPLAKIGGANLRPLGPVEGDLALQLIGKHNLGYMVLWPHARPWKLSRPEPMLRALPDAAVVGERLARAVAAIAPVDRAQDVPTSHTATHNGSQAESMPTGLQGAIA